MNIFVINLHNRPERFFNTIKNLKKCNLSDYVIRKCGCTIDRAKNEFSKYIDQKAYNNILNIKSTHLMPTWGAVACAISHYEIYEYIVKNKIQNAVIIEDSFEIDNLLKFNMFLNEGFNILNLYSELNTLKLVFLNYNGKKIGNNNSKFFLNNYSEKYEVESYKDILDYPFKGLQFYMINYQMACQLTSRLLPLSHQIDIEIGNVLKDVRYNCKVVWDNLSNIYFYNFIKCGNRYSNKFLSDVQYYFPNLKDFEKSEYFKSLNSDILKHILSFCNINNQKYI